MSDEKNVTENDSIATGENEQSAATEQETSSLLSQGGIKEKVQESESVEKHWMPEKYHVKGIDGAIDLEASAKKQSEAYIALEKKLGVDGGRPKTSDDYTFEVPQELAGQWNPQEDEQYLAFRKEAHGMGFTQKQFEYIVNRHLEMQSNTGIDTLSPDEAAEKLRYVWKDEATFKSNLNRSDRAVRAYANDGSADVLGSYVNLNKKFGNDPDFIALMANIGRETAEDIPPMGALMADESVDELMHSPAYWNQNDPQHKSVVKKVEAHFARKYGNKTR